MDAARLGANTAIPNIRKMITNKKGKEENSLSAFLPLFGLVSEYFDSYALPAIIPITFFT
jgi:hypothetical protein